MPGAATQQTLMKAIKREPAKTAVLSVLMLVLLVLVGRSVIGEGGGLPASALARNPVDAGDPGGGWENALSGERKSQGSDAMLQKWVQEPIQPIGRNLFAVELDYFPTDGRRPRITLPSDETESFWDELAKSLAAQADQEKERRILEENLQRQASELRLQSTVMGSTPKAMLNGELVKEGDVVAKFRVVKIEARRIIVERHGVRIELPMN